MNLKSEALEGILTGKSGNNFSLKNRFRSLFAFVSDNDLLSEDMYKIGGFILKYQTNIDKIKSENPNDLRVSEYEYLLKTCKSNGYDGFNEFTSIKNNLSKELSDIVNGKVGYFFIEDRFDALSDYVRDVRNELSNKERNFIMSYAAMHEDKLSINHKRDKIKRPTDYEMQQDEERYSLKRKRKIESINKLQNILSEQEDFSSQLLGEIDLDLIDNQNIDPMPQKKYKKQRPILEYKKTYSIAQRMYGYLNPALKERRVEALGIINNTEGPILSIYQYPESYSIRRSDLPKIASIQKRRQNMFGSVVNSFMTEMISNLKILIPSSHKYTRIWDKRKEG